MDFHKDNVAVCAWCDEVLRANPFTRTYNRRLYLFCTVACLNSHYRSCTALERSQTTIAFDVVA